MSEARVTNLSNESNTGGPTISGITTFSGTNYFLPPIGNTQERPLNPEPGSLRFNTDTTHLEYYRGDGIGWVELEATSDELDGGTRGLVLGGSTPSQTDRIDYHNLSSPGTWVDFGNLFSGRYGCAATSSRTRGVIIGGYGSNTDTVDYVTISTLGDSVDALNTTTHKYCAVFGDGIRACVAGSYNPQLNTIDYVDIATLGSNNDFGDLTEAKGIMRGSNSSTRGIIGGGYIAPSTLKIDYVTIASTGNAQHFGDLISSTGQGGGNCSNAVRSFWGGQYNTVIGYITMATLGDALDFGDMLENSGHRPDCASPTRGMWCGGKGPASPYPAQTHVDYIEMATTGNARDFGDLSQARSAGAATSNGHGGL